jgi:hypothetical protein
MRHIEQYVYGDGSGICVETHEYVCLAIANTQIANVCRMSHVVHE